MQKATKRTAANLGGATVLLLLMITCFIHIDRLSEGVYHGLCLCAEAIIPTLFPFLIFSELLLSHSLIERILSSLSRPFARLLRIPVEGGIAFLMGNLFGFPMGAKAVAHYYRTGSISKNTAEKLLLFSGNASPFFLIGSVGLGMLGSTRTGVFLYLNQILISFFCGLLLSLFSPHSPTSLKITQGLKKEKGSLPSIVRSAVKQTLFICGYILFFSAVIAVILPYIKNSFAANFIASVLEIGSASAFSATYGGKYAIPFCAFAASFAGISVFFQTLDCIEDTDLNIRAYLPTKLLCGIAAFLSALILT